MINQFHSDYLRRFATVTFPFPNSSLSFGNSDDKWSHALLVDKSIGCRLCEQTLLNGGVVCSTCWLSIPRPLVVDKVGMLFPAKTVQTIILTVLKNHQNLQPIVEHFRGNVTIFQRQTAWVILDHRQTQQSHFSAPALSSIPSTGSKSFAFS